MAALREQPIFLRQVCQNRISESFATKEFLHESGKDFISLQKT